MNMEENLEHVIGFDALYESMNKCRQGVIWKDSVAAYCLNGIERTMNLSNQLNDGSYKSRPPVRFKIQSPKPREISSIIFRDRVYQRSLNDNVVYPTMTKSFIYDNYACQKEKGTDAARERLKEFLHRYFRKHGNIGYVAQFDIHGYYPNMNHDVTKQTFRAKLQPKTYQLVETILDEQYEGEKGYNPGSQLVQIAGISVLDGLDHYIKEQLHAELYIRYMDDFLIISHDKEYLKECMESIGSYLSNLKFELNPTKTRIYKLNNGINFLGFRFMLTDTGKVLMFIRSDNVKRQRKKLLRLANKSKRGLIPKEKVDEAYATWRNHASKGNSYRLLQKMDAYYNSLWR